MEYRLSLSSPECSHILSILSLPSNLVVSFYLSIMHLTESIIVVGTFRYDVIIILKNTLDVIIIALNQQMPLV